MPIDTYRAVRDFESALCEYTGARYAVTTTSCTMALLLAVAFRLRNDRRGATDVLIPKRTYVSVPMSIIHGGGWPVFEDREWIGQYALGDLLVYDSARWLTSGMYDLFPARSLVCLSFHWSKHLGISQGGAILCDEPHVAQWLKRARFDGRKEGVAPKDDEFFFAGWHCYMSPETAAAGLMRLALLPKDNDPLPNDDYPDLSKLEIFRR